MTRPLPTDELLRERYESGATIAEIANDHHVSRETVRRAMIEAGIERRPRGQPVGKYLPRLGLIVDHDGYFLVRQPGHPHANSTGYVYEHRLIVERAIDRLLTPQEVVGHLDGDKGNNSLSNLWLYATSSELMSLVLRGNDHAKGDVNNPKRSVRRVRTMEQMLHDLRVLGLSLGREIQRKDLEPPNPSYRAVANAFGSWREGVKLALTWPTGPFAMAVLVRLLAREGKGRLPRAA